MLKHIDKTTVIVILLPGFFVFWVHWLVPFTYWGLVLVGMWLVNDQRRVDEINRQTYKAREEVSEKCRAEIKALVEEFADPLALRRSQLVREDAYGNEITVSWESEITHFIESSIASRVPPGVLIRAMFPHVAPEDEEAFVSAAWSVANDKLPQVGWLRDHVEEVAREG